MRDHERIEELLAVRALDGLEPGDAEILAAERARHGPGCGECARLEREYSDVAGHLARALDPVPVRPALEDEIVARAVGRAAGPTTRLRGVRRSLSLAAAAAALLVGGWVLRDLTLPESTEGPPPGFLAKATIVRFQGSAEGDLAVAFRPDAPGAYLIGTGLQTPSAEEVYELWLIDGGQPVSGGCFAPEDGTVVQPVDAQVGAVGLLAVTLEPADCPDSPTSDPILTADMTAV